MATLDLETLVAEMTRLRMGSETANGYFTFDEIVAKTGLSRYRARQAIKDAVRVGKMRADRVPKPNVTGQLQPTVAYTVV